ncbi:MAG: hypothetical protein HWE34_10685 [Methylocystaceae bacterium]|nr:hypothetical protein [Methylocystaceae bacterium]
MAIQNNSPIINFDRGIGRIGNQGVQETLSDQTKTKLAPSEANTSGMVARLQNAPTLSSQTRMAVMPYISDREILSPHKFEDELKKAMKALDQMGDHEALNEMRSAIEEHQNLQEALQYFREMLFAG